ncbi:MAG: Ig-like domain-containing protein [Clostridia bacterium]|nr:Ig-like domain-containing protein [Clostridia bacterium]
MNNKKLVDIICAVLVIVLFAAVVVLNVVQADRPTVSELEKRQLAQMPSFSFKSLTDGTFFSGISSFISDTFVGRDKLVELSKQMDTLKGIDYSVSNDNTLVILNPGQSEQDTTDLTDKINDALNQFGSDETDPDTQAPPDTSDTEGTGDTDDTVRPPETDDTSLPFETDPIETDPADTETEGSETVETPDTTPEPQVISQQLANGDVEEYTGFPYEGNTVTSITLDKDYLKLTPGTGSPVTASVATASAGGAKVTWSVSDRNVAEISPSGTGGIVVKAVSPGTCTLTCRSDDGTSSYINVEVEKLYVSPEDQKGATADFLPNGLFIYGDAVYTPAYYNDPAARSYATTMLYYKRLFGSNVRVDVVIAPVSSMVIDDPAVVSMVQDQKGILDSMKALMDPSINFVDTYTEMYEHRNEYLFFKSDHHWTARGAYYAYAALAKSLGFTPTPIENFGYKILSDYYVGSMYQFTYDERVKAFYDYVEAFIPTKAHTMTITDQNGYVYTYDSSIVESFGNYLSFISGDHPYTVINVPDNPQDRNCIVLKDSFGNAFVPFLCEHFGNIFVVDVRHTNMNVFDSLSQYNITDVIFMNNIQAANNATWAEMFMNAVGVSLY